jgi:HK97 family phage major capsid protein
MSETRHTNAVEIRATGERTVELSFSSEAPVPMRSGVEILDHSAEAVDMSRMQAGAPVLFQHDTHQQIGVVERAWIDTAARKGRAVVRFSKNPLADEVYRDIRDGIRRLISVGYDIISSIPIPNGRRVTRWQPAEISVVSIPADISVGVGRSHNSETSKQTTPSKIMSATDTNTAAALESERERIATITTICREWDLDSDRPIRDGWTVDKLREKLLDGQSARRKGEMTSREALKLLHSRSPARRGSGSDFQHDDIEEYSVVRAINAAASGRALNGLEAEVHQELARNSPEAPRGILIPLGNLNKRDLTATGTTSTSLDQGGMSIATGKGDLIDYLREALTIRRLGATVLTGLRDNFDLPRTDAAATATWKAENAALDEVSQLLGQLALRPKRLGCFTEISRQLLVQSSSDVEAWVRRDLGNAIAGAWEAAAIAGTGASNQPTGILSTAGIGSVVGGTNGLAPTWAHIVALESAVANVNAAQGSMGYLVNTKTRGKLKTTIRNPSGTDSTFIWPDDNRLNGYATEVSNHVPSTLTKGSSSGVASAIIFGNWQDLVLAQWGAAADIIVNPYIKDTEGLVRVTAATFVDAGVRQAKSFAAMQDALAA